MWRSISKKERVMKIFVVVVEQIICGCGIEAKSITWVFDSRENAEDFCRQFNEQNKSVIDVNDEPDFNYSKATVEEVNMFDDKVKYLKANKN